MSVRDYYTDLVDRAVKTAAQSAVLAIGADQFNVVSMDWPVIAGFAGGGFALSVLTNVGQRGIFGRDDDTHKRILGKA